MQLEALAEKVYRRPVALFFLPVPPEEEPGQREFRTLPDFDATTLAPDTLYAIREAHAFQRSLLELTHGRNPAERIITHDLRAERGADPGELADRVRDYLGITLEVQQRWQSTRVAINEWRSAVESAGVFVFKRSFKQREISGFCIADDEFPVIVINNSTAFTRQSFTLFHELAHLLFGLSGVTKDDAGFVDRFAAQERDVEIACNQFAADVLVPTSAFNPAAIPPDTLDDFVSRAATRFRVSKEVILRRLLDRGLVERNTYVQRATLWNQEADSRAEGEGGGNYYATQQAYLGGAFLGLAFAQLRAGNVSLAELSEHLGMKARNIGKLEDYLLKRG
jgi:Zn-dependent peptidase ImmA (M78 family)